MTEEKDLTDVMRAEKSRGKRKPVNLLSLAEARKVRSICADLLRPEATEADFLEAMRAFGIEPGTERFAAALRAWRAERRS